MSVYTSTLPHPVSDKSACLRQAWSPPLRLPLPVHRCSRAEGGPRAASLRGTLLLYERVRVLGALLALDWALRPACPGARMAGALLFLVLRAVHDHGPERRAGWQERPTLPSCSRRAESLQRDLGAEKFSDLLPPWGHRPQQGTGRSGSPVSMRCTF